MVENVMDTSSFQVPTFISESLKTKKEKYKSKGSTFGITMLVEKENYKRKWQRTGFFTVLIY